MNNQQIENSILDYVKSDLTEHALMISGDWGTGKTYYWLHNLKGKIENLTIRSKPIKTVYVSLYGVSNVIEISKKIFFGISLPTKIINRFSRIGGVVPELAKAVLNVASLGGFNIGKEKIDFLPLCNLKNVVLCFDDLERSSLDSVEVLGYINNLVEHDKIKTIIICNEEELKNSNFANAKEKLIGRTFTFTPDFISIINNIVNSIPYADYKDFLLKHIETITKVVDRWSKKNIRVFKYFVADMYRIYCHLIINHPKLDDEIYKRMIVFCLALSYESRVKPYHVEGFSSLQTDINFKSRMHIIDMENKEREDKLQNHYYDFVNLYFGDIKNFTFFKSIDIIVREGLFNSNLLDREIKQYNDKKKPAYRVNHMSIIKEGYWLLSDHDFVWLRDETLEKFESGELHFSLYFSGFIVYRHFARNRLINLKEDEVYDIFNKGLDVAKTKYDYCELLEHEFLGLEKPDGDLIKIKSRIEAINADLKLQKEKKEFKALLLDIKGEGDFIARIGTIPARTPIFSVLGNEFLFEHVLGWENADLVHFRNYIKDKYETYSESLITDIGDMEEFAAKIEAHLNKEKAGAGVLKLSHYILSILLKELKSICKQMEDIRKGTEIINK